MKEVISRLDRFHKTKQGYFVSALVELFFAYIFGSIAIDTANLWAYAAALILTVGAALNFINLFAKKEGTKDRKG